jgi:methionyl-tRNA formyltransferase
VPQPAHGVTYAKKMSKQEADLDWTRPCAEVERRLRALRPAPGARTLLRGEAIKLWRARCATGSGAPGSVLETGAAGVLVACGEGALLVSELQRAGGTHLAAADFLRGCPIAAGERLGAAR